MANKTDNYSFILPVGSDKFNPLTDQNPNWETADSAIKKAENQSIAVATEIKSGSVHAITLPDGSGNMFRFVATSKFSAQDTCTVNGTQVTTLLPNGTTLPEGGWVINSNVLCCMTGTVLTVYTTIGGESGTINADTLDGHSADYFATATALNSVKSTAESAGRLAATANDTATAAATAVAAKSGLVELWHNDSPTTSASSIVATLTNKPANVKLYMILVSAVTSTYPNLTPNYFPVLQDSTIYGATNVDGRRGFTVSGDTITFKSGARRDGGSGTYNSDNSAAIPYAIYAIT